MNRYNANDTMRLLAKQNMVEVAELAPDIGSIVRDIMTASGIPNELIGSEMIGMGVDIILYGAILGKRIERKRNKSKYGLTEPQKNYMRIILEDVQKDNQKGGVA